MSWGESGTAPGQFNLVHNISCDPDGWVYVADRENHRIQVFDGNGRYETQFNNLHRPCGIFMPYCSCPICYVGELGPATRTNRNYPNLGPRLSIIDNKGNLLARIGGLHPGIGPQDYIGPHGLTVDSTATSTSARCRAPYGRNTSSTSRFPRMSASCASYEKSIENCQCRCVVSSAAGRCCDSGSSASPKRRFSRVQLQEEAMSLTNSPDPSIRDAVVGQDLNSVLHYKLPRRNGRAVVREHRLRPS